MSGNRVCHFKLVLLGDTAVGKSCLVVRFVRDEFFEFQEPTIGGELVLANHFFISVRFLLPGFVCSQSGFVPSLYPNGRDTATAIRQRISSS